MLTATSANKSGPAADMGRIRNESTSGVALFFVFSTLLHGVDSLKKLESVEPWGPSTTTQSGEKYELREQESLRVG